MTKNDFFNLLGIDKTEYDKLPQAKKQNLVKIKANAYGEFQSDGWFKAATIESIYESHKNHTKYKWAKAPKTINGEIVNPCHKGGLPFGSLFNIDTIHSTFRKVDHFLAQKIFIDSFHEGIEKFKNGRSFERMGGLCWFRDYVLDEYLPAFNVNKDDLLSATGITEERIVKELENASGFSFDFIARICMYLGLDIERESRFATNLRLEQYLHDINGEFPDVEFVGTEWNNLFKQD